MLKKTRRLSTITFQLKRVYSLKKHPKFGKSNQSMKMKKADEQQEESLKKKPKPNLASPICENKKTRDLPNLSECQACGYRIDACTGKNRIQILYSEWRIVLLCKRCISRVNSSKICSYCFKETTGDNDYFSCCQCKRCVHRNCFLKYRTVSPWSYASSSVEFSVCVDCWVPKSIMRRRGFFMASKHISNSRVLKDMVKGSDCASEMKIVLALMAPPVVAKKPIDLASNTLDLDVKRDEDDVKDKKVDVDDAEFAFKLHRTMNSSPRISKNLCAVNSSSSVPKIHECNDDLVLRGSDSGNPSVSCELEDCASKKINENPDRSVLDPLLYVKDGNVAVQLKEGEGSCSNKLVKSSGDENSSNFESRSCHDNLYESANCRIEICNGKPDRYLLKYRKRNPSSKTVPNGRPKILYERLPHQSQPAAAGLSINCSRVSRTPSNGSLQSCAFPLQASSYASDLSPDDS